MNHTDKIKSILESHFDLPPEHMVYFIKEMNSYIISVTAAAKVEGSPAAEKPARRKKAAPVDGSAEVSTKRYPQFVKMLSLHNKGEQKIDLEVTPVDNFANKTSASHASFTTNLIDMVGTPIQFKDMFSTVSETIHAAGGKAPGMMALAGICWGMLSDTDRTTIVAPTGE